METWYALITSTSIPVVALAAAFYAGWNAYRDRQRLDAERREHEQLALQAAQERARLDAEVARERERLDAEIAQERAKRDAELKRERLLRQQAEQATIVAQGGSLSLDRAKQLQEERDAQDFERNRHVEIVAERLELAGFPPLGDGGWTLQPGLNVLLGRNGYGKSLVLRALASLLTRSDRVLAEAGTSGRASLAMVVDGRADAIVFGEGNYRRSIGPVPVLAIPDTRFVNRSEELLRPPPDPFSELARQGARHLIEQQPYQGIVQGLLHGLCLDFIDNNRSFDLPVFKLLAEVFAGLTDESFRFASVERIDTLNFRLEVITEGNPHPVPIQAASQGTLSVLAVFGLVFRFLSQLAGPPQDPTQHRAIVMIDELDAHLHPHWQQRVAALLRRYFPNVQFILSAHSPLLVAGCLAGEVAVMRKAEGGFRIERQEHDFLGARAKDIYETVFEIEDGRDPAYLDYSERVASGVDHGPRIRELESILADGTLDDGQRLELDRLRADAAAMSRAQSIEAERAGADDEAVRLETELVRMQGDVHEKTIRIVALEAENKALRAGTGVGRADAA